MLSVSKKFRDRPETPLELAVWWIEFALRNPDLSYMKSPVLKLGFLKANNFDILLFVVVALVLVSFFIVKCFSGKDYNNKMVKNDKKKK